MPVKQNLLCLVHLKQIDKDLKIKHNGKELYETDSVKHLEFI